MAVRFFDEVRPGDVVDPMATTLYSTPRSIVAAAERLKLDGPAKERVEKRDVSVWQTAAWQYWETIGEIHFAFSLIGQIMSRIRLYTAVVEDPNDVPVNVTDYLERLKNQTGEAAPVTTLVCQTAKELLDELILNAKGSLSGMLRTMAINLSVPGELYLLENEGQWIVASIDELVKKGDRYYYTRSRQTRSMSGEVELKKDGFIARIWRQHPRWSSEPDSSMLGVLDDCELLVLMQQTMRGMTRSRMNAGILFLPEGITSVGADGEVSVEDAIAQSTMDAVQVESSLSTVVPRILRGPADLGEKIKWIAYGRALDAEFVNLVDRALQRVLQGLDIPKDMVTGMSDVKYANAIVINEDTYKSHVEPLVLLVIDALTSVYLRPLLKKRLNVTQNDEPWQLVNRIVVWADTSMIVTRPDRSTAANDGFDRDLLSERAWRNARGFSEHDAPDPEERLRKLVASKGQIPPEIVDAVLRRIDPEFFDKLRQDQSELPTDIEGLLAGPPEEGEMGPAATPTDLLAETVVPDTGLTDQLNGAELNPNGQLPPVAR